MIILMTILSNISSLLIFSLIVFVAIMVISKKPVAPIQTIYRRLIVSLICGCILLALMYLMSFLSGVLYLNTVSTITILFLFGSVFIITFTLIHKRMIDKNANIIVLNVVGAIIVIIVFLILLLFSTHS